MAAPQPAPQSTPVKPEVPAWFSATGSAFTALHPIDIKYYFSWSKAQNHSLPVPINTLMDEFISALQHKHVELRNVSITVSEDGGKDAVNSITRLGPEWAGKTLVVKKVTTSSRRCSSGLTSPRYA